MLDILTGNFPVEGEMPNAVQTGVDMDPRRGGEGMLVY